MAPGHYGLGVFMLVAARNEMAERHRKIPDDSEDPPYHSYKSTDQAILILNTTRSR
jgi:hypothetical protein